MTANAAKRATPTGEPSAGLRSTVATYNRETGMGSVNRARYSNPVFDQALAAAMKVLDDAKREEMLQEATRIVIESLRGVVWGDHPNGGPEDPKNLRVHITR